MPCSSAKLLAPSPTRMFGGTRRRDRGWLLVSRIFLARDIGFFTPNSIGSATASTALREASMHTRNSTTGTASAEVVDNGCIALHHAINVEVASEPRIGNLLVLEAPDGSLHGLGSRCAGLEKVHTYAGSSERASQPCRPAEWPSENLLGAGLKMDLLIHHAVIAGPCVDEYGRNWPLGKASPSTAVNSAIPSMGNV